MKAPFIIVVLLSIQVSATPPTSGPSPVDPTLDWLMTKSPHAPATQPVAVTQPATPFKNEDEGTRPGVIVMNNGDTVHGRIATTAEKPVRVWVEAEQDYEDIPFNLIKLIEAKVIWERDEKEWHFKASGSDIKEYSGKTYPARETQYKLTLVNGQTVEGPVVCPLYVTTDKETKTYVLYKRDKGDPGQTLDQLKYIKSVKFSD